MANFRTTADYLDSILLLCGEVTNGNSPYETRVLHYLNRIHNVIIAGGNEFNVEVDELWPWAISPTPITLELKPKYETGSVALTNNSTAGTFSGAPSISLAGYHIIPTGSDQVFKIVTHTAGQTAFTIDGLYNRATASGIAYKAVKLDYDLIPEIIPITSSTSRLGFTETTAGTVLTASVTPGSYTPAALATELRTQLEAAGASDFTVSYDTTTRNFTILSNLSGGDGIFKMLADTGSSFINYASILPILGFGTKDYTGATSSVGYESERALGAITKLVQPLSLHTNSGSTKEVHGIDRITYQREYPLQSVPMGNPTKFTVIEERADGLYRVRMNKYVEQAQRLDVAYIPQVLDLADVSVAAPLVPRKFSQALEYGAASYLAAEKNDSRAGSYYNIAATVLEAMVRDHRKTSVRTNPNFGSVISREDLLPRTGRDKLKYGYTD